MVANMSMKDLPLTILVVLKAFISTELTMKHYGMDKLLCSHVYLEQRINLIFQTVLMTKTLNSAFRTVLDHM